MLQEIFKVAAKLARGEIRRQRINGKMVPISLNQRQRWIRVADHIAKTMNSIGSNLDEREINLQLDELEKLVNEATANQKDEKPKTTQHARLSEHRYS
jgi:hypothetical protein